MRMVHEIEIERPPTTVWPWLTEPDRMKQWMKGLLEVTPLTEGPVEPGFRARLKIKEGARVSDYDEEITAYDPPRRLAMRMWGGAFPEGMQMELEYVLENLGSRTVVRATNEIEVKGFMMKLFSPLMRLFGGLQQKSFFRRLKKLVETA